MTTTFIAYTRVSTQKQGAQGVSLAEQRRAISSYAHRHNLRIICWEKELATAAKHGRPVFRGVMQQLERSNGQIGLFLHKIDRGARNLRDWADIGDAIDRGVTVRFTYDDLDLESRSGRLSADIQAVIAVDFIRNLREEVRKGIAGRLRQGLYPFKAPRGYLDQGRGRAKIPDPRVAPLIVHAFRCYATGRYSLNTLSAELYMCGLSSRNGLPLRPYAISKILRNPFYKGTLVVRSEPFPGIHQPLVTPELFNQAAEVLKAKRPRRRCKHAFQYRRLLGCSGCGRHLIGECQKGRIYYRCHVCSGVCVREDRISTKDRRFRIIVPTALPKYAAIEPWEKFDSPRGC